MLENADWCIEGNTQRSLRRFRETRAFVSGVQTKGTPGLTGGMGGRSPKVSRSSPVFQGSSTCSSAFLIVKVPRSLTLHSDGKLSAANETRPSSRKTLTSVTILSAHWFENVWTNPYSTGCIAENLKMAGNPAVSFFGHPYEAPFQNVHK